MTTDEINTRIRMIESEINVHKQDVAQLRYRIKDKEEKVKDNKEKIKLNKALPYLVAHVVEVRRAPEPPARRLRSFSRAGRAARASAPSRWPRGARLCSFAAACATHTAPRPCRSST